MPERARKIQIRIEYTIQQLIVRLSFVDVIISVHRSMGKNASLISEASKKYRIGDGAKSLVVLFGDRVVPSAEDKVQHQLPSRLTSKDAEHME